MLLGIDQLLLDMVACIDHDPALLDRHGLQANTQQLAEERHKELLSEFRALLQLQPEDSTIMTPPRKSCTAVADAVSSEKRPRDAQLGDPTPLRVTGTPGGVVANSLRGAAWWLRRRKRGLTDPRGPRSPAVSSSAQLPAPCLKALGIVGRDTAAKVVSQELQKTGVQLIDVEIDSDTSGAPAVSHTGVCLCLVRDQQRTMLVDLGAAKVPIPCLVDSVAKEVMDSSHAADGASAQRVPWSILLTSGFYAQADASGIEALAAWHRDFKGSVRPAIALTVGAEWCCGIPVVQNAARAADIVFGNEAEFLHLSSKVSPNVAHNAECAAQNSRAALVTLGLWKSQGWLVMTRGSKEVLAIRASSGACASDVICVSVPPLNHSQIADDVGAGDAFMGGFLASLWVKVEEAMTNVVGDAQGLSVDGLISGAIVEQSIRAGNSTAAFALTGVGCQFPKVSDAPSPRRSYKKQDI